MANNATGHGGMTERELALWMLEKMKDSDTFLGILRKSRVEGQRHVLDTADIRALHVRRLKMLHQGDEEETVEVPVSLAGTIAALVERDLLSGPEELIEKAIAAYVERTGERDLPRFSEGTIEMARAEIEGRTQGQFDAGFVKELAEAARAELAREAEAERDREQDREREG
jgi:hypothetical protein